MSAWPLREWPSGENYPFFDGGSGGDEDDGHLSHQKQQSDNLKVLIRGGWGC